MTTDEMAALLGRPLKAEADHGLIFWGYAVDCTWQAPRAVFDRNGLLDSWMTPG